MEKNIVDNEYNSSNEDEESSSSYEENESSSDEDENFNLNNNSYSDNENEYFIENYKDYKNESSDSSSESNIKVKKKNKNNNINIFNEEDINENDSILILSSHKTIKDNKIIYRKKVMINAITSNFTVKENLIVNSIFNYNTDLLLKRNKNLNEYILIKIILNCFNIELINNTISIFPPIPWNKNIKKYKKNYDEIINLYDFKKFKKNNKCVKKDLTQHKNYIVAIVNGFVFYIKNLCLLKKDLFKNKTKELEEFKKIIFKDENSVFCLDENLQVITSWLSNLVKRILLYNFSLFILNTNEVKIKKNLDEEIYVFIIIVFYLIILVNDEKKIIKNNINGNKLKTFLIFNYQDTFIKDIINNEIFKIIIEYIYKNKNKKVFLCKKKYINIIKNNFL